MESVLDYQERVDELKKELIGKLEKELKNPHMSEFDMVEVDCDVDSHYSEEHSGIYCAIESVYLSPDVMFRVAFGYDGVEYTSDENADGFTAETILSVLKRIRSIAREIKLAKLRKLVASGGGKLEFDGSYKFTGDCEGRMPMCCEHPCEDCRLDKLELVDDTLVVFDTWDGTPYDNDSNFIPDYELDGIIDYVKNKIVDISLNQEQEETVEELKKAFQKLADLDVAVVYECDYGILEFFSKRNIEEYEFDHYAVPRGEKYLNAQGQLDAAPNIEGICYYNQFSNEQLLVKPKS